MKRKRQLCEGSEVSLSKIWPIFTWELCVVCKEEFRREHGWRHTTHGFRGVWRYVCCECCPTKQEAHDAVVQYVADWKKRMEAYRPGGLGASPVSPA